jgi:hypothetical protein
MEIIIMQNRRLCTSIIFIFISALLLVSCNKDNQGAKDSIEAYINALSNKDSAEISNLSCADWEQNALVEVDSLTAVGSRVENLVCNETAQEGDVTYISCTGNLALDYNGEVQQIDLSNRTYVARNEDGEWRMCGYK